MQYYNDGTSIPDTHGTYTCPSSGVEIAQAELSFYPNPVDNILRVAADKIVRNITIYNLITLKISGGIKNIFNSYQKDFDRGADRDSGYIYGPGQPRTVFISLKIGNIGR